MFIIIKKSCNKRVGQIVGRLVGQSRVSQSVGRLATLFDRDCVLLFEWFLLVAKKSIEDASLTTRSCSLPSMNKVLYTVI